MPPDAAPDTALSLLQDWGALISIIVVIIGSVWTAVTRANRQLEARIGEAVAKHLGDVKAEGARVDELRQDVSEMRQRLSQIERRVEDLYHLLVTVIDPRRLREPAQPAQPARSGQRLDDPCDPCPDPDQS